MGLRLQWLDKVDRRTPVSDPLDVPSLPIAEDGTFAFDIKGWTIPVAANSLAAVATSVNLTFQGNICGDGSFLCGEISALYTDTPEEAPASTFTFQRIKDPAAFPEPMLDCKQTPLLPM